MRLNINQFDGGGGDAPAAPIKVSQATVDAVKNDGRGNMGQAAANKVAYGSPGYDGGMFSPNAPVSKEYKEATKRVYPNAKATSPAASSGATNPKQPGPKSLPPVMTPPSASGATNPKQPGPKVYGGPAAEKYKADERNAKNKAALPPVMTPPSASGATNPKQPGPKSSANPFPPLMTPPSAKPAAPTKVKVSQATVDSVKSQGKAKAIANAKTNVTNPEYKEAVRRIYQSPAKPKAKAKSGGGGGRTSSAVK